MVVMHTYRYKRIQRIKNKKKQKAGALFSNVNAEGKGGRIWLPLQKSNTSKIAFNPDLILEVEIW